MRPHERHEKILELLRDNGRAIAERLFRAAQEVLAEIVILVKHGDFGRGNGAKDISSHRPAFLDVAGQERHGPRERLAAPSSG